MKGQKQHECLSCTFTRNVAFQCGNWYIIIQNQYAPCASMTDCYCFCILFGIFWFFRFGISFHFLITAFSNSYKFGKSRGVLWMYRFSWSHICVIALRSWDCFWPILCNSSLSVYIFPNYWPMHIQTFMRFLTNCVSLNVNEKWISYKYR